MATNENQKLTRLAQYSQEKFLSQGSLLNQTRLERFILIAFLLHTLIIILQSLVITKPEDPPKPTPIKIKYVDVKKPGPIVKKDGLKNKLPKQNKLNQKVKINSKIPLKHNITQRKQESMKPKKVPLWLKKRTSKKNNILPLEKRLIIPKASNHEFPSTSSEKLGSKGVLSMLNGFDAEKYSTQDAITPSEKSLENDEPISLDTTEAKYFSYFNRIKHQIQRAWQYPTQTSQRRLSGQLTLKFQISRDGNLLGVHLVDDSGFEILDIAAVKAVKEAAPYYPFPITISKKKLSILATFVYSSNAN